VRVLVTGFEPFGGDAINPSAEIARNLPRHAADARLTTAILPVVYYRSLAILRRLLILERPDAVLCLGMAGGAAAVTVETRAVNLNDARMPDNDGQQPEGEPIRDRAPASLPPTVPLDRICEALGRYVPVERSESAGTFLCNHVFYALMDYIHHDQPSLLGGFVHVPFIAEQHRSHRREPFLELDSLVQAVRRAILSLQG